MGTRNTEPPSNSAVKKAASTLRRHSRLLASGQLVPADESNQVFAIVDGYRNTFRAPLQSVNGSLRSYVRTLNLNGEVTQRLKRTPTIVQKLTERETRLNLFTMRDIGGCRIVLATSNTDELYELAEHIQKRNPDTKLIDYVKTPRFSGYRALHLEVVRNGKRIEVQLRTAQMHEWAEFAEALSDILGQNFKSDGESTVHQLLMTQSRIIQATEEGLEPRVEDTASAALLFSKVADLLKTRGAKGSGGYE